MSVRPEWFCKVWTLYSEGISSVLLGRESLLWEQVAGPQVCWLRSKDEAGTTHQADSVMEEMEWHPLSFPKHLVWESGTRNVSELVFWQRF